VGGVIALHDIRKMSGSRSKGSSSSLLHSVDQHSKSINAAYISPDGEFLVSVSQDNTVKVVRNFMGDKAATHTLKHNNVTGRWLSTFRTAFDPKAPSSFVLGSMVQPRRIEVFRPEYDGSKNTVSLMTDAVLEGEYLGSVCSRNCFHPSANIVAGGNSSGRVHIFR
jgi:WD40 repeat protein